MSDANVAAALWTKFMASVRYGDHGEACHGLSRLVRAARDGKTPDGVTAGQLETMFERTCKTLLRKEQ
jgi:hypothetical protein